jgi:hypothetical protein
MPSVNIDVPKSVMVLPEADRDAILGVLAQAVRLPAVREPFHQGGGDEHDMWSVSEDALMASMEEELYTILNEPNVDMMTEVFMALGLPFADYELQKSKNNGKSRISDLVNVNKEKREQFMKYMQDMNPFSQAQIKKLDALLKSKLPNYAKIAEEFMTRAGFIAKIRNKAEQEAFETMGALIDRFPKTIKAAENKGVVLTVKEQKKAGRKVMILPLTPLEARSVQHAASHAADKLTEISERHRAGVRQTILQAQRERWEPQKLTQELYDAYGDQNRDWRRVALTELAMAVSDAYLAGCEEGDQIVGMGAESACKYCKELNIGRTLTVLKNPPKVETYDTDMNYIWVGKSNYGRKVSAWRPAFPSHPCCRCRMHRISKFYNVSKDGKFELKSTAQLIQEERAKRGLPPDPNLKY